MAVDVIMPQMGESIFEGTITKWLKKPGDKIERDEPLFEISTDKVDAEIPSPSAGVLKEIKVTEGQTVPIQTVVAVIDADGAGAARLLLRPLLLPKPRNPRLLRPSLQRLRHLRRPLNPLRPPRHPPLRAEKKFAAPLSSAKSRANMTLTSRRCQAPAPVDASASTTSSSAVEGGAHAGAPRRRRLGCSTGSAVRASSNRRRLRLRGSRKRGPARENVLRPLRSPAHVRDAPAHRRTHGALEARFAARVLGG